jgi:hypothetical protein
MRFYILLFLFLVGCPAGVNQNKPVPVPVPTSTITPAAIPTGAPDIIPVPNISPPIFQEENL